MSTTRRIDLLFMYTKRNLGRAVLAIFGILLIVGAVPTLPEAWRVDRGGGTRGEFVSQQVHCGVRSCRTTGTWTSDDGSVVYRNSTLQRRVAEGERVVTVAFPESGNQRIYEPNGRNAVTLGVLLGLGLVATTVAAVFLRR